MVELLHVRLHGETIGYLERGSAAEDPSFTYDSDYIARRSVPLSANLPIGSTTYDSAKVAPYLLGLLPESQDARSTWANKLGTSDNYAFEMLSQMGWDCPGAVQFCKPEDLATLTQGEASHHEIDEARIAARLRRFSEEPGSWTMPEEHWSLGGQQEKFALARIDGKWFEAHDAAATTHILKPGIKRLHHQALIEHATMSAARQLGVDVAATEFLCFEDQWAIVVERFDRDVDPDGTVTRFHQEDFCQALGRTPDRKCEARGGPTIDDMVRLINKQSTSKYDDLDALADFLLINVVAGAPDGHSKNISMLHLPEASWIAPLYDLASAMIYDKGDVDRTVAIAVGSERQVSRIRRKQWAKAADKLGLPEDRLVDRVAVAAEDFPGSFLHALEQLPGAPGVDAVGERAGALQTHCAMILNGL
jgi:serine/threonine-protein kinase HipA